MAHPTAMNLVVYQWHISFVRRRNDTSIENQDYRGVQSDPDLSGR